MSSDNPFVDFPAGATLLREGEAANAFFILESGKVAVRRAGPPAVTLTELGPGDFVGEMSILQEQPHSATVEALTAVRALKIEAAAFHAVLRENIEVAVHLMQRLVLRLKGAEQRRLELEAQLARSVGAAPAPVSASASAAEVDTATSPSVPPPPARAAAAPTPPVTPDARPAGGFVLVHADGRLPLPPGKTEFLVGRPDPATGAVPEVNLGPFDVARSLSRRHARLRLENGELTLQEEPGVGNGTWVNGGRLLAEETVLLHSGDQLRFGAVEVRVERI